MDNFREDKHKYMDLVQGVINRMASNSFALKGWAVTLVAGIFALASKDADKCYFIIAYIPIIVFWGLDTYYLWQERLYRALYNKVRKMEDEKIDFDMNTNKDEFKTGKNTYLDTLFSVTELFFYLPLAIVSTAVIWIAFI